MGFLEVNELFVDWVCFKWVRAHGVQSTWDFTPPAPLSPASRSPLPLLGQALLSAGVAPPAWLPIRTAGGILPQSRGRCLLAGLGWLELAGWWTRWLVVAWGSLARACWLVLARLAGWGCMRLLAGPAGPWACWLGWLDGPALAQPLNCTQQFLNLSIAPLHPLSRAVNLGTFVAQPSPLVTPIVRFF